MLNATQRTILRAIHATGQEQQDPAGEIRVNWDAIVQRLKDIGGVQGIERMTAGDIQAAIRSLKTYGVIRIIASGSVATGGDTVSLTAASTPWLRKDD